MLMKVDSNTKGNTYWFYFKVQNFRIGVRYTFNIFNFTRSIEKFYKEGMNIVTRAVRMSHTQQKEPDDNSNGSASGSLESPDPWDDTGWRYNTCRHVLFEASQIARHHSSNHQCSAASHYHKLTFSYTFTEEDQGKCVQFAYAVPYTYTDLLADLNRAKRTLLRKSKRTNVSPTLRVLNREDYIDYAKFKNFHDYQNED